MTMSKTYLIAAAMLGLALTAPAQLPKPKVAGKTVETARHKIELDASGLPAQIHINAAEHEIPVTLRRAKLSDAQLQSIERGPQLRGPIRIEAVAGGNRVTAKAAKAAAPRAKGDGVVCAAKLAAGAVMIDLETTYAADGSLAGKLTCSGGPVDELELVVDIAGAVDAFVVGAPLAAKYDAREFVLPAEEGKLWGNAAADAKTCGRAAPGVVKQFFVGSGGRGFTWMTDGNGFVIDPAASMMTLERDKKGAVTWRIKLVNKTGKLNKSSVNFKLLTHPAVPKSADFRKQNWFAFPARTTSADKAVTAEATAGAALLAGKAGAEAPAGSDIIAQYPVALFRYLAGTHTGLHARIRSNSVKVNNAGGSRIPDRAVLGRALVHDIGVDAASLAHVNDARRVVAALHTFGIFAGDGNTEFLPYWRNRTILRYGENFVKGGTFNLSKEDPHKDVLVSAYIRQKADKKGFKAAVVLLNESDEEVRGRLHILNSVRLMGAMNAQTMSEIVNGYDYSMAPDQSDYSKTRATAEAAMRHSKLTFALKDMEDHSAVVRAKSANPRVDIYGPIHIRAHDFRVLHLYTSPDRAGILNPPKNKRK